MLEGWRDHDRDGDKLSAQGGPESILVGAFGEESKPPPAQIGGPGRPFVVRFGIAAPVKTQENYQKGEECRRNAA